MQNSYHIPALNILEIKIYKVVSKTLKIIDRILPCMDNMVSQRSVSI